MWWPELFGCLRLARRSIVLQHIPRIIYDLWPTIIRVVNAVAEDRLTDRIGLGVLTRLVHRDLVDEVLADTGRTERRRRLLPARVVVYFVLAMTLFFDDAYEEVMRKLVEGLRFLRSWDDDWQVPTSSALCQARARLGAEPLRELYARVARPLAGAGTPGAWLGDLRVMAIDGVQLDVPDTADNEDEFGRGVSLGLDAPYPKVKVLGLGECGTHAVIDAHLGGVLVDERELARPLLASIEPGHAGAGRPRVLQPSILGRGRRHRRPAAVAGAVGTEAARGHRTRRRLLPERVTHRHRTSTHPPPPARGLDTVPQGPTVRVIEYDIANRESAQRITHPVDHHHPRSRDGLRR